jgi:aryl-alcohol dehydrogenase-like predicted oxidoreductase
MSACARIGLGTVQWGMPYGIANTTGQPAGAEVANTLRRGRQVGINLLDTAAAYGAAEARLGESDAAAQGFQIVTKTAPVNSDTIGGNDVAAVLAAFARSLQRLKCGHVYGLMAHHADSLLAPEGARLWDALQELKRQGLVARIGVSVYTPAQLSGILDRFPIEIVQLPFNVYDQRFLRAGLLDRLQASGVEVHARSAFLQGLLLMPSDRLPGQFEAIREHHRRFHDKVAAAGLSPLAGSLGFCLAQPQIDKVIVGCESTSQLDGILDVVDHGNFCDHDPIFKQLELFALDDEAIINPSRWSL